MSTPSSMESGRPALSQVSTKPPASCLACSQRKVKCDKQLPCMNCRKRQTECTYATARKKRVRGPGKTRTGERLEEMTGRVAYLEGLIEKLQSQVQTKGPAKSSKGELNEGANVASKNDQRANEHSASETEDMTDQANPRLLIDGDKNLYIGSRFWAKMNKKYGAHEGPSPLESDATPTSIISTDSDAFTATTSHLLFGASCGSVSHEVLRPPTFLISTYWHFFISNFDPIYKIIHKPHVEKIILKACEGNSTVSPSHEALLFAICLAVTTSLTADQVKEYLLDDRAALLHRYCRGLESSLAQAGLLCTTELTTLQALVIYIICIRRYGESRTIWTLVGLASRIALGMGLHHDGAKFNISPWMIEMRRRVWWHIYLLDMRAAEDQGCEMIITSDLFDTKMPLNINDDDLDINATVLPPNGTGMTEMTMGLMRLESTETGLAIGVIERGISARWTKQLNLQEKLDAIKVCERSLHQKYLQQPRQDDEAISVLNYTLAKLAIAKMTLTVYHQNSNSTSPSKMGLSRDELLGMSISVCESAQILESLPIFKPWAWDCQKYIHWYAVAYILMELCSPSRRDTPLYERAWRAIDGLAFFTEDVLQSDRAHEVIYRPIRKLLEQARQQRAEAQITQLQYESRLQEFEQWNMKQFQDIRPNSENFDWFYRSDNPAEMPNDGGSIPISDAPVTLSSGDFDLQDNMDMTGLFDVDSHQMNGTMFGGASFNGWLYT